MEEGTLLALAGLGAVHGLNPAMGWLFAVAIGLQERSRRALAEALVPIAIGHEASVALTVLAIEITRLRGRAARGGHRRGRGPDRVRDLEAPRVTQPPALGRRPAEPRRSSSGGRS